MNRKREKIWFNMSTSLNAARMFSVGLLILILSVASCDHGERGSDGVTSGSMYWMQFRGQNSAGIAPANANPPVHFNADSNLLWKAEMIRGWSSPCIVNNRIFLTGFDDRDSLLYTLAIDRVNGEILWKDPVIPRGYYEKHPMYTFADATVASDGHRIFASFPVYGMIAYDLDGKREWEHPHELISQYFNGGASSPVIVDSMVILIINSEQDPRIVALNSVTGDLRWSIRAADKGWGAMWTTATPVIYKETMILHFSDRLVSVNISDGEVQWWLMVASTGVTTPVLAGNMMYINTWINGGEASTRGTLIPYNELLKDYDRNGDGKIVMDEISEDLKFTQRPENQDAKWASAGLKGFAGKFDVNKDKVMEEQEWNAMLDFLASYFKEHGMQAVSLEGSGERPVTDIRWKINKDTPETPSPLVVGKNVMFIKNGGIMTIIDRASGKVVLHERIGAAGGYFASPMLAGNRVYLCSFNGTVTVLSGDDFHILARNRLREKIGASPVAVDNVLYIRTNKHLYAFRTP